MKKLNTKRQLFDVNGTPMEIIRKFANGNLVVVTEGQQVARTVDSYGFNLAPRNRPELAVQRVFNTLPETVEYLTLYPNGNVYTKQCCPVKTSSYGVENLIQIKVTRRGDKIIRKEFC